MDEIDLYYQDIYETDIPSDNEMNYWWQKAQLSENLNLIDTNLTA